MIRRPPQSTLTYNTLSLHDALPIFRDIESDGYRAMVSRIQNELFDLGADLATPYVAGEAEGAALRITPAQSTRLETEMDEMNEHLEPLRSFILPGGLRAAAALHQARTVARREERQIGRASCRERVCQYG